MKKKKKRSFSREYKKRFNGKKKKNVIITQTRLAVLWNEVPTHILTL